MYIVKMLIKNALLVRIYIYIYIRAVFRGGGGSTIYELGRKIIHDCPW